MRDPYPAEGATIRFQSTRMGSTVEVGSGSSGEAGVGCAFIDVTNESAVPVTVELRYGIAEMQG